MNLHQRLTEHPDGPAMGGDAVLERFLEHVGELGLELYPAQEEAILELYSGKNLILNTPTGSGKSLVASALHLHSLAAGRRSFYTSPIKALVNEKFLALCRDFGPDQVGMITGDGSVNPGAPIICCTAEILANDTLRSGSEARVDDVVIDEFHFYSDRDRGWAWQVPLLALPQARFLLMSATLGDTGLFEKTLTSLNGRETAVIRSVARPVPLEFHYSEEPLHAAMKKLIERGRAPIYLVNFTQAACAEEAQNLLSVDFCTKEEKKRISDEMEGASFRSPYGKELQRLLKHGVGLHHAGLLPRYRLLVEKLAQKGLLKVICGTDTLGVGVNVPIRTVLFTRLCKFDGEKSTLLSVRDFQQISGRAGRKGYDDLGTVVAQAPEHLIENLEMERKAAGDPKKLKKIVKRKPPDKGYVHWDKQVFERLIQSPPETLQSRFQINHGMLLNVLSRTHDDGCQAMRQLIDRSHESENQKKRHRKHAFTLFRSLVERGIIRILPSRERGDRPGKLELNVDLQQDFSLHQTLSLWLIDTWPLLDRESPDYARDLLTLVESIVEDPELILRKQLDRLKTEKLGQLKAEGMDYDQRMEELERLEYPKPRREFIYESFNRFAAEHPWIGQENIRPKSIAREMVETFMTFAEYVKEYGLQRSEGLLLRYLSEVYKALVQTVPEQAKNDEILAIEEYLGTVLRQIDSSLIEEWEKLRNPAYRPPAPGEEARPEAAYDLTRDPRRFPILIRNEVFRVVRALSGGQYEEASEILAELAPPEGPRPAPEELEAAMAPFYAERLRILTDPRARAPQNTRFEPSTDGQTLALSQMLLDPEEKNDVELRFRVDLQASRTANRASLIFEGLQVL